MSLVNDALKRAKQAQNENPPPTPPLHFQPVDPAQESAARSPLLLVGFVLALILVVTLGGVAVWFVTQKQNANLRVEARPAEPASTVAPVLPTAASNPLVALAPTLIDLGQHDTNTAIVADSAEPPPLKLQGIFFNPRNPSAVVGGRTVYVGERVNGCRVVAITPASVTLFNGVATNVLSLSQ
jgi:hypothetical protein